MSKRQPDVFSVRQRKAIPHEFVLDAFAPLSPVTRPLFSCLGRCEKIRCLKDALPTPLESVRQDKPG
jgi:hypothetical protein